MKFILVHKILFLFEDKMLLFVFIKLFYMPHFTVKLIVKFHLTIVILISRMQMLDKIRQLSKFDKLRQRGE
jgi:hypothetical protein